MGFGETMDVGPDSTLAQLHERLAGRVAGYLEFGIEVQPAMAWKYPTVTSLAQGIHDELHARVRNADG